MNKQEALDALELYHRNMEHILGPEDEKVKTIETCIQLVEEIPESNGGDTINRQDAIDALGEEPEVWTGKDEYAQGLNNQWHYDINALKAVPSVQPEVIRFRDCKHHDGIRCFAWNSTIITSFDDFRSNAERRSDE